MVKSVVRSAIAAIFMFFSLTVFAAVEVNTADQAALDGIKGIGPSLSKAILAERSRGGNFKDWADLEKRVKGVSEKNSVKFSSEGLQVNGSSKTGGDAPTRNAKPKSLKN